MHKDSEQRSKKPSSTAVPVKDDQEAPSAWKALPKAVRREVISQLRYNAAVCDVKSNIGPDTKKFWEEYSDACRLAIRVLSTDPKEGL